MKILFLIVLILSVSCTFNNQYDLHEISTRILSNSITESELDTVINKLKETHNNYQQEYKGSNDIIHFLKYINDNYVTDQEKQFYTVFFVYQLINNPEGWSESSFFLDKPTLRLIEEFYSKFYRDDFYINILSKAGAKYFTEYHENVNFKHFEFFTPKMEIVSTSKYQNKILIIDFGATWCSPCKEQAPFLNKTIESFNSKKDVQFLSVSLDKDVDKWLDYYNSSAKHINQQHGIINENNLNQFRKEYGLNGIPRYFIIDSDGIYITYDAPNPKSKIFHTIILENII